MSPVPVVRHAHPDELERACALWLDAENARTGIAPSDAYVKSFLEAMPAAVARPGAVLLVAVDGEVVVGTIYGVPLRSDPTSGQVAMLGVHPTRWGNGVGTQLLAALVADLRGAECTRLRMNVDPDNGRARAFYEHHGWRWDGETEECAESPVPELVYRIDSQASG